METAPWPFWKTVTLILLFAVIWAVARADRQNLKEPLVSLGSYDDSPYEPRDGYVLDGVYYMQPHYMDNFLLSHGIVNRGDLHLAIHEIKVRRSQAPQARALFEEAVKQGRVSIYSFDKPVP